MNEEKNALCNSTSEEKSESELQEKQENSQKNPIVQSAMDEIQMRLNIWMDRIELYQDASYLTKDIVLDELRIIAQILNELETALESERG